MTHAESLERSKQGCDSKLGHWPSKRSQCVATLDVEPTRIFLVDAGGTHGPQIDPRT